MNTVRVRAKRGIMRNNEGGGRDSIVYDVIIIQRVTRLSANARLY